jgi:hypothetical protein
MENTFLIQPEMTRDDSLRLASLIQRDVSRTLMGIHAIVAALLQYALLGASITNNLIELAVAEDL